MLTPFIRLRFWMSSLKELYLSCISLILLVIVGIIFVESHGPLKEIYEEKTLKNNVILSVGIDRCIEDGHVYSVNAKSTTRGTITPPTTSTTVTADSVDTTKVTCPDGTLPVLQIVNDVASPTLLYPLPDLHYLFGAYTSAEVDTVVQFTARAVCGAENVLCEADITYNIHVIANSSTTTTTSTSTTSSTSTVTTANPSTFTTLAPIEGIYPNCTSHSIPRMYKPGMTHTGDFPLDIIDSHCVYTASIEQPSVGVAVVMKSNYPMQYLYRSPVDCPDGTYAVLPYKITCNDDTIVCEDVLTLYLHEEVAKCARNQIVYEVLPGATITGSFQLGELECPDSAITLAIHHDNQVGALSLSDHTSFVFTAPPMELNALYTIRAYCQTTPLCEADVAFLITKSTHTSSTSTFEPTGSTSSSSSSSTSTTSAPRPENYPCSEVRTFAVPTQHSIRGTLNIPTMEHCTFATYTLSPFNRTFIELPIDLPTSGNMNKITSAHVDDQKTGTLSLYGQLEVNIIGDFVYTSQAEEGVETVHVNVACMTTFYCQAEVHFIVYHDVTSTSLPSPSPSTITTSSSSSSSTTSSMEPSTITSIEPSSSTWTSLMPLPSCPDIYYYQTKPSDILHASIDGVIGELTCPYAHYYLLNNYPAEGLLEIRPNGHFTFTPRVQEGLVEFSFTMYCVNNVVCRGDVHILVSHHWTSLQPTVTPGNDTSSTSSPTLTPTVTATSTSTSTNEPESFMNTSQFTCHGTCTSAAWKSYPPTSPPSNNPTWDNSPDVHYSRKDGKPVDGMEVTGAENSLVITAYSLIGNMAVRFPTFQPLPITGVKYFDATEYVDKIESSLPAFQLSCLEEQSHSGLASDVWIWTSSNRFNFNIKSEHNSESKNNKNKEEESSDPINNKRASVLEQTGTVGVHYKDGDSWYHKFGGKHVNCDTFVNACQNAPLMTPQTVEAASVVTNNESSGDADSKTQSIIGQWALTVDDCDATWKGTFPLSTLPLMKDIHNVSVWENVAPHTYHTSIFTQAIQPQSWSVPSNGINTQVIGYDLTVRTQQFVSSTKSEQSAPLYSIDTEFFEYIVPDTNDLAFGVNILVYPYVTPEMTSSYAIDRHVIGFKWTEQSWQSPSKLLCPTCTGTKLTCHSPYEVLTSAYTGPFADGDCPTGTPMIYLTKGPSLPANRCSAHPIHVIDQPGFSPPQDCRTTFQNLTFRGVLAGSGRLDSVRKQQVSYEGTVQLQLLMADGARELVDFHFSLYTSQLALQALPTSHAGQVYSSVSSQHNIIKSNKADVKLNVTKTDVNTEYESFAAVQVIVNKTVGQTSMHKHIYDNNSSRSVHNSSKDAVNKIMSVTQSNSENLELHMCRAGDYWPVLDPLGESIPTEPFVLAVSGKTRMCVDVLSSSFGPNDWAVFALTDVKRENVSNSNTTSSSSSAVRIESVYVVYGGTRRVYLEYRNPITGAMSMPHKTENVYWWQHTHPFINFRNITSLMQNNVTKSVLIKNTETTIFAFALIPGAINIDTNAEIVIEVSHQYNNANNTNSENQKYTNNSNSKESITDSRQRSTFRKLINIDPQLTQRSRLGPKPVPSRDSRNENTGDLYAIGAVAGVTVAIIVVAIFYMIADNKRPLPKWIPRGKLIKQTVLSILPANLRKSGSREKPVVHKDMYAAMTSGHY